MEILIKILKILILCLVIYLWNRFIVKNMIKALVGFHKRNNIKNLNKQPIKFLVQNEHSIYNFAAGFYWIGIAFVSIIILTNE